ncbi:hypothetical protein [Nocardia salmonicida]|uniref:hypothetical protein n=1 Tax=Nocardia salmonicida TaxID=53431 RepID=UPI003CEA3DB6
MACVGDSVVGFVDCGALLAGVDVSDPLTPDGVALFWSGFSLDTLVFGFDGVVSPVDGVSVGLLLLLLGLDGSVSPGELSGAVGLFGVEGGAESVAPLPSVFDGAESPAGGVPFVALLFGVAEGSPVVGASGVLF